VAEDGLSTGASADRRGGRHGNSVVEPLYSAWHTSSRSQEKDWDDVIAKSLADVGLEVDWPRRRTTRNSTHDCAPATPKVWTPWL